MIWNLWIPYIVIVTSLVLIWHLSLNWNEFKIWWQRLGLAFLICVNAFNLVNYSFVLRSSTSHGCFPWSPQQLSYTPGMTICPGQQVVITVILGTNDTPEIVPGK